MLTLAAGGARRLRAGPFDGQHRRPSSSACTRSASSSPGFAALIPTLLLAIWLGLFDTREFMILYLPASAQPLAVILLTQFMRTVPVELEESARIDGAGRLRILCSVYLPLVLPGHRHRRDPQLHRVLERVPLHAHHRRRQPEKRTLQVALPTLQGNQGITTTPWCAPAR